jgi:hypothetical protein
MAVELVKQAIRAFLRTPTPQVLCIRGKWGVGKTFIWNEVFTQAEADGAVALPYYCYVSLFSLHSIDEVRQSIFENRVPTSEVRVEPTFESMKRNVKHLTDLAAQQFSRISSYTKVPYLDKYVANFSGGFRQIVSLAVRDTIICFDDFERKNLSAKDLLGLISQLREQRRCKGVIILNEDALSEDEKTEFRRYFEKVVDIPIEFAPTAAECAEIVVKGDEMPNAQIRQNAITLGISNIRIVSRVKDVAQELLTILAPFGDGVKQQAIHSLTLFLWSRYDDEAVPTKFIVERAQRRLAFVEEKERTDDERKWGPKLESYKFGHCDTFDLAILKGVGRGFFDEDEIAAEAAQQDARHALSASQEALYQAWRQFHDSFADNTPKVVEAIHTAYKTHMQAVSRGNLDEAALMLRRLGFPEKASDLITAYVEFNKCKITAVDDSSDPFHPTVNDEEFRTALASVATPRKQRSIEESLTAISQGSYRQEDEKAALALSADDFYKLFKSAAPDELSRIIEGGLFWRRVSNATESQREMTARTLAALAKIGGESQINAVRVKKYGISLEPNTSDAEDDGLRG